MVVCACACACVQLGHRQGADAVGGRPLERASAHFDMESTNFDCFASPSPVESTPRPKMSALCDTHAAVKEPRQNSPFRQEAKIRAGPKGAARLCRLQES